MPCHLAPLYSKLGLEKNGQNIHSSLLTISEFTQASVPSTCKLICRMIVQNELFWLKNMVPISHLGTNLTGKCPAVWRHGMFPSAVSLNVVLLGRNRVPIRAAINNYFCRLSYPLFFNYSISRDYLLYFHQPILDFCLT